MITCILLSFGPQLLSHVSMSSRDLKGTAAGSLGGSRWVSKLWAFGALEDEAESTRHRRVLACVPLGTQQDELLGYSLQ